MTQKVFDSKQQIQEAQYEYPYHYIPTWEDGGFSQVQYWCWGFRYLGGMQVVFDQLAKLSFDSLIDIGCGDGRFLREAARRYPYAKLLGVDYSQRGIQIAKAMNPNLNYKTVNIVESPISERFDVATLIEVLEHVPPVQIAPFLEAIANVLNDNGWLILTVPHSNKGVQDKHYQNFKSDQLRQLLEPHFRDIVFIPFDVKSRVMTKLQRLIGGEGKYFALTNSRLLSWFYQLYINRYLYTDDEQKCWRIAALCGKR